MKLAFRDNFAPDHGDPGYPAAAGSPTVPGPVALKVSGLSKYYGAAEAVRDLNFEIREGEIFGLLGPNGAGKTTTIAILATQRRPSGGEATLFGRSACREPHLVRRMLGLAPQETALYPALTAAENLRFFGRIYGVKEPELGRRVDGLLALVGLEAKRGDRVDTLSGGMKRRLNLAAALVHRPKLILLDEPTAGVDPQSRSHIFEIIRRLRDDRNAILYTTHHMEEAETLCDRIGIMDRGTLAATGTLSSLTAAANCPETIEIRGLTPGMNLDALRSRAGVVRIDSSDGLVRFQVRHAAAFLETLQQIIGRCPGPVQLKIAPPTLEQIFLQLTGRELHD